MFRRDRSIGALVRLMSYRKFGHERLKEDWVFKFYTHLPDAAINLSVVDDPNTKYLVKLMINICLYCRHKYFLSVNMHAYIIFLIIKRIIVSLSFRPKSVITHTHTISAL